MPGSCKGAGCFYFREPCPPLSYTDSVYVGLIDKTSTVVIHRLDRTATWAVDPAGTQFDEGYDPLLREPIATWTAGTREVPREELAEVKVPCQVETMAFERLRLIFGGDAPVTQTVFVLDRRTLRRMSLLDATTGKCLLQRDDRISRLERRGSVVLPHQETPYATPAIDSLFVYEVRPASWGFGRDGYNLELLYTYKRLPPA